LRAAGPWGKNIMAHFRGDLIGKFDDYEDPEMFLNYIFYCNNQTPAPGEDAFQLMKIPFAWAKLPLVQRYQDLPKNIPVTFIYGRKTWMCIDSAYQIQSKFSDRKIDIYLVKHAGHHVMLDNPQDFNTIMAHLGELFTKNERTIRE